MNSHPLTILGDVNHESAHQPPAESSNPADPEGDSPASLLLDPLLNRAIPMLITGRC